MQSVNAASGAVVAAAALVIRRPGTGGKPARST
jgi:hypothetical protein